MVSV
jgi:hypothetical protein